MGIEFLHRLFSSIGIVILPFIPLFFVAFYIDYNVDYMRYHKCKTFQEYLKKECLKKFLKRIGVLKKSE